MRCPKTTDDGAIMKLAYGNPIPVKALRHFPLIPRLKRLFMPSKTAPLIRWYAKERKQDDKLRHPADAHAGKDFDNKYSNFACDARNVRLCLSSNGFNPFSNMST